MDNNKWTNNTITNQESLSNKDHENDSTLNDYGNIIKQIDKKQINDEKISSSEEMEINRTFDNLLNDQKFNYEDSSSKNFDNDNINSKENIQSDSEFSSSTSKSTSTQEPSVDTHYIQVFDKNGNFIELG